MTEQIGELDPAKRLMLMPGRASAVVRIWRCSGNRRIVAEVGGRRKSGSFRQGLKPI